MTPTQAVVGGYVWDPESCFRGTSADGFVYFRMPHRPVSEVLLAVFMIMGALTLGTTLQTFVADPATELEEKIWVWTRYGTAFRALYTMYEVGLVQLSSMRQCCIFTRVPEGLWTKPLGDYSLPSSRFGGHSCLNARGTALGVVRLMFKTLSQACYQMCAEFHL